MSPDEREEIIRNYLAYLVHRRLPTQLPTSKNQMERMLAEAEKRSSESEYEDAWVDVFDLIAEKPEEAWSILVESIARCEQEDLGTIGAGELESFVHRQAERFASPIESEIRNSPRFRQAFRSVYIGSDTPAAVGRAFNTAMRESGESEEHIIDWWSESGPSNSG